MDTNVKNQIIQEAIEFYKAYKANCEKLKPYVLFNNFLESLKTSENKPLIESVQRGVEVLVEEAGNALRNLSPDYFNMMVKGKELRSTPEGMKKIEDAFNYLKNPPKPDNKRKKDESEKIMLESFLDALVMIINEKIKKLKTNRLKDTDPGELEEIEIHTISELITWLLDKDFLVKEYDPENEKGAKYSSFVYGAAGNKAFDIIMNYIEEPIIYEWKEGADYSIYRENSKGGVKTTKYVRYGEDPKGPKTTYKRIGENIIPEDLRSIPPNSPEVSEYWEKRSTEEGTLAHSNIVDSSDAEEKAKVYSAADTSSSLLGKVSETPSTFEKPGEELEKEDFMNKVFSAINMAIDDDTRADFWKEALKVSGMRMLLPAAKPDKDIISLREKYNLPFNEEINDSLKADKAAIVQEMKTLGKKHFVESIEKK